MSWLELKIPPLLLMLLCGFGIFWFGASPDALTNWALLIPGALTGVLGVILLVRAVRRFMAAKTTVNPHTPSKSSELVIEGEYRWTRNPMYLGMLLILIGLLIVLPSVTGGAIAASFFVYITRFQIMPEERLLEAQFGGEYREYKRRVRRWI
ncbi:methyltransferase family protein [Parvularcula marina]|uniref:Isoprenylcysteine carboxylmethyltransferase family protein n=1 Tax=Parvularcula marina TaxID=2292771 RepID=A0A371RJ10_9PROT|nr:isoprenylcysteine carboxylmethyltransferase family protein [Parvularcula marina]RFB05431.1 isoprenylcysteine carboxylmethyltransferase family protein [Parvularcula marina]